MRTWSRNPRFAFNPYYPFPTLALLLICWIPGSWVTQHWTFTWLYSSSKDSKISEILSCWSSGQKDLNYFLGIRLWRSRTINPCLRSLSTPPLVRDPFLPFFGGRSGNPSGFWLNLGSTLEQWVAFQFDTLMSCISLCQDLHREFHQELLFVMSVAKLVLERTMPTVISNCNG